MTDHAPAAQTIKAHADDFAAAFQIEGWPVRGRLVRLGEVVDKILSAHDYPAPVAGLLGEACVLAAIVGSALKFEGRLIVQAQGDGPVRYVVADYDTAGTLRGFCRFDPEEVAQAAGGVARPGAQALLGQGVFIMTIDRGEDFERTQGITPIEGDSLSLCAEHYFTQSEQVPTKVRLAVGEVTTEAGTSWRAGGAMIQVIAGDSARGSTEEVWERTRALFHTLGDDELIDPTISAETLLYRLFHEDGVRLEGARSLAAVCRCSKERLVTVMQSFPPEDRAEMVEDDGMIHATCEYCSTIYKIDPQEIAG
ncbi:Hsp33 family molecular chaperone [Brevundimonas bullata]|uniref:Hsp33 family molecular chaperone n=1 Tax=Brevundimonas bullata TaxID=13160 RepID=UPI000E0B084E|nr:Hsp33 family molecular chaperone [Brevundimonas bullata]WQE35770.1 Hsp33 family molecular chaperone [Brevundimonas bullata]